MQNHHDLHGQTNNRDCHAGVNERMSEGLRWLPCFMAPKADNICTDALLIIKAKTGSTKHSLAAMT